MEVTGVTRRDFLRTGGAVALAATTGSLLSACGSSHAQTSSYWENQAYPLLSVDLPGGAVVKGYAAPAFRPVFDAFVKNFTDRNEIGASVAGTLKGLPVLEAWGGFADALAPKPSQAWQRDTVSLVFSCTKGATALCAHLLDGVRADLLRHRELGMVTNVACKWGFFNLGQFAARYREQFGELPHETLRAVRR